MSLFIADLDFLGNQGSLTHRVLVVHFRDIAERCLIPSSHESKWKINILSDYYEVNRQNVVNLRSVRICDVP